jgi:hypothetical protein
MRRARPSDAEGDALLSPTSTSGPTPAPVTRSSRRLVAALAVGSALGLAAAGGAAAWSTRPASALLASSSSHAPPSTTDQLQALLDQRVSVCVCEGEREGARAGREEKRTACRARARPRLFFRLTTLSPFFVLPLSSPPCSSKS